MVAFSGAAMPGPLLSVTVTESARRGAATGPLLILGHAILEISLIILLFLGIAPLLEREGVFIGISIIGSVLMLYLAYGMLRSIKTIRLDGNTNREASKGLVLSGALMSLANPYWIIWWATIGLGYILRSRGLGIAGVSAFFLGHIIGDLVWYAAVSTAVSKGRRFLNDARYRVLIGVCGTFMAGFAVYLLYGGIERWVQ